MTRPCQTTACGDTAPRFASDVSSLHVQVCIITEKVTGNTFFPCTACAESSFGIVLSLLVIPVTHCENFISGPSDQLVMLCIRSFT
jgi:hypothetical protein